MWSAGRTGETPTFLVAVVDGAPDDHLAHPALPAVVAAAVHLAAHGAVPFRKRSVDVLPPWVVVDGIEALARHCHCCASVRCDGWRSDGLSWLSLAGD